MNKKDLIDLGIAEDVADKVVILHGKGIESHKATITTMQTELDTAQGQLTEANKQIEDFKGMNVDQIKAAADEWKTKYETSQTESASQLLAIKRSHALERDLKEIYKVKPNEIKSVMAHLKDDAIQYNEKDDAFIGLKEQIDPFKPDHDYLFDDGKVIPKIVTNTNNQSVLSDKVVDAARKGAGLVAEQK